MKKILTVAMIALAVFVMAAGCDDLKNDSADNSSSLVLLAVGSSLQKVDCVAITGDPSGCWTNVPRNWCTAMTGTEHETGWCTSNGYSGCVITGDYYRCD
jgi:hypothetical protein